MNNRDVLEGAAGQFRSYEEQHRAKAAKHAKVAVEYEEVAQSGSSPKSREWREQEAQSLEKAQVNKGWAETLEDRAAQPQTGFERVRVFHERFGLPVNGPNYQPTLDDRLLRGRLLLEEVIEHLTKGLGLQFTIDGMIADPAHFELMESELHEYDPVETLDGIADIKVIANGTGVVMGLPVEAADAEVFRSNMSKLDANGQPIVNGVTEGFKDGSMSLGLPQPGYRSDLPVGKVLKSEQFSPADIAGLLQR